MTFLELTTIVIAALTLFGVALGHYPRMRMNRATITLVGATLLVAVGAMTLDEAFDSIDMNIIALLFATMIISVNLSVSGFFGLVISRVTRLARSPKILLALVISVSGASSALFLNDVVVLMFAPLVLETARALGRRPMPYLIGLMTSANIGSTATIVGNPQNMLIGVSSGIPYLTFASYLAPVALAGMGIAWAIIVLVYRREFARAVFESGPDLVVRPYKPLLRKSVFAVSVMLAAFVSGVPVPLAALSAAAILLTTRRLKPARVFRELDWSLLVFFSVLFVVTGALESSGISGRLFAALRPAMGEGIAPLSVIAAGLSNIVSNVPAVLLFRPFIAGLADPQRAWLALAMSSTLAGNLTLLGSVANLIVAESAGVRGAPISFLEYLKAGVPITILTLATGILWLSLVP